MPSFRFTVYDPDVCELMKKLRQKRGVFVEVAVREFLKTEKGQEFVRLLLNEDLAKRDFKEKKKRKISIDEFL